MSIKSDFMTAMRFSYDGTMRGEIIVLLGCLVLAAQAVGFKDKTSACGESMVRSGLPDPGLTTSDGIREEYPPVYIMAKGDNGQHFGTEEYEQNVINTISARSSYRTHGINRRNVKDQPFNDRMTPDQIITQNGYPCEVHKIQTDDGYVLQHYRIPSKGIPVLLIHGILDSSVSWVIAGKNKGLAYILADLGYDVWMGNTRGNEFSRNHISMNPNRKSFWLFSFHEVGYYDLPGTIDFILKKVSPSHDKIHFVGHSQGTTAFFVMASLLPQYSRKVLSAQALAPVAFVSNMKSPLAKMGSKYFNMITLATEALDLNEFLPHNDKMSKEGQAMCLPDSYYKESCQSGLYFLMGPSDHLNETLLPNILDYIPSGTSRQSMMHYLQLVLSGVFAQYDYGVPRNVIKYGMQSPPRYDLGRIKIPIGLYYAKNDWIADPFDVQRLKSELKSVIEYYEVSDPKFNHIDFMWGGTEAKRLVYDRMIEIMGQVEKGQLPVGTEPMMFDFNYVQTLVALRL